METISILAVIVSLVAVGLAFMAHNRAVNAEIIVKAMEKSTHTIQYVQAPLPKSLKGLEDMEEKFDVDYASYNKEYSEELKETMPAFAPDEDERKVRAL